MIIMPMTRAVWTPPGGGGGDPFWSSVVVLCHLNSNNGGNPTDWGNEVSGAQTVRTTFTNQITLDTGNYKFGPGSAAFPAVANPALFVDGITGHMVDVGTQDFTEEWFQYFPNVSTTWLILDSRAGGAGNAYAVYCTATGQIYFFSMNTTQITSASNVLVANTWQHIAVSRNSGTTRLFVDGVSVGSFADTNNYNQSTGRWLGNYYNGFDACHNCLFDEWRLTVGVGRYTSNFTPPSAPFPNF